MAIGINQPASIRKNKAASSGREFMAKIPKIGRAHV